MRTRAGQKEPAPLYQLHGGNVDVPVPAVRPRHLRRALAEGGRVQNDAVELLPVRAEFAQKVEGVALHRADVREPVARRVLPQHFERALRNVVRDHLFGDERGVQRKAAAVAKAVQHPPARGIAAQREPVLLLVEEKARLLPVSDVDAERQSVLGHGQLLGQFAVEEFVLEGQPFLAPHGRGAAHVDALRRKQFCKTARNALFALVHAEGKAFEHDAVAVAVGDERGQPVRLAEHHAVVVAAHKPFAQRVRLRDLFAVERVIVLPFAAQENAHEDLGEVVDVAFSDEPAVVRVHACERPVPAVALDLRRFVRVHPAVPREQAALFALFQIHRICHTFCAFRIDIYGIIPKSAPPRKPRSMRAGRAPPFSLDIAAGKGYNMRYYNRSNARTRGKEQRGGCGS